MNIRRILSLGLIGVMVAIFSGCGGGGGGSPSVTPPSLPGLPPDPGVEGDATVAGIDSNNNGVRDDVERALHARHPNISATMMRAFMQDAKSAQMSVMAGETMDVGAIDEASRLESLSITCLTDSLGTDAIDEVLFIEATTVNTRARSEAYINYNSALSGQFFGAPEGNTCE